LFFRICFPGLRLAFCGHWGKLRSLRTVWLKKVFSLRAALAVAAGLTLTAAFPRPSVAGLAWLAPGLMLLAGLGAPPARAFRLGYLAGLTHYLTSLYWLLYNPFPAGALAGWLALSLYLALYPALWVWLCWRLSVAPVGSPPGERRQWPWLGGSGDASSAAHEDREAGRVRTPVRAACDATVAANVDSRPILASVQRRAEDCPPYLTRFLGSPEDAGDPRPRASLGGLLQTWGTVNWSQRTVWCLSCAALWVGLEMVRARFLTGFAWNFLGVSQVEVLPLIQIASVTGVYGVSFLVAWGSVALLVTGLRLAARLSPPPPQLAGEGAFGPGGQGAGPFPPDSLLVSLRLAMFTDLALPLMALIAVAFAGTGRLARPRPEGSELKVALVQPSIPQRLIFDPKETNYRFHTLMELSRLALAAKPDLLVWPEASLPPLEETHYRAITNMIATAGVWMVFGADDAQPRPGATKPDDFDYFNSAFLFDAGGHYVATYSKVHLVIFGEYVPLMRWLPFLRSLTPIEASFTPGPGPAPFVLTQPHAKTSVLICFEDVFPHLARRYVETDTDFVLNLTNNGWFGESAAQWQHAANAAFRAVENGLPLVRCANNGLTCWVDALGRMRDVGFGERREIYAAGFKTVRIPLLPRGQNRPPTFYRQHGDWLGWSCVGWAGATLALRLRARRPLAPGARREPGQPSGPGAGS
jgi:apolipoprotein N-acyltransferase